MLASVSAVSYTQPSQPIDHTKVEMAERQIQSDVPMNASALADAMRNPNLNQAERDQIVSDLAKKNENLEGIPAATLWKDEALGTAGQLFMSDRGSLVGKVVTAPDIPGVGNPVDKVSKAIA